MNIPIVDDATIEWYRKRLHRAKVAQREAVAFHQHIVTRLQVLLGALQYTRDKMEAQDA